MSQVLHLDASARNGGSLTRLLSHEFVELWKAGHPECTVRYRDLAAQPVAPVDGAWIAAAFDRSRAPGTPHPALRESDALVDELLASELVVIGTPVYNFTVPAALKAWIDQVIRVGRTFAPGAFPSRGLAGGRRVVVLTASMNDYLPPSPHAALDHLEPYLRTAFGFMGIDDVTLVRCSGAGEAEVLASLERARSRMRVLAGAAVPAGAGQPPRRAE